MSIDTISRRNYLAGFATISTPAGLVEVNAASNQVIARSADAGPIKIVCAEKLTEAEEKQIRAAGKNIDMRVVSDRAELQRLAVDAEVILGTLDGAMLPAAA